MMHIRTTFEADRTLCGRPTGSRAWEMSYTAAQYIARATRTVRDNTCEQCQDALVRRGRTPADQEGN